MCSGSYALAIASASFPSRILLASPRAQPRILDFGAKINDSGPQHTSFEPVLMAFLVNVQSFFTFLDMLRLGNK